MPIQAMTRPNHFKHIALVGKYNAPGMAGVLQDIAEFLRRQGAEVSLERETAVNTGLSSYGSWTVPELGARCDLAVVVGGDGTMLGIARQLAPFGTPLVGINEGRLGFITDVSVSEYEATLAPMMMGDYVQERRSMLQGQVWRHGQCIFEGLAMNDVVVSRGATASMVELKVHINQEPVANFRADGLIVSSPTGSTAYALSAGGPILHPGIAGWVMVPIAPHDLSNRPIVLPDSGEVSIEVVAGRDVSVNFDMQGLAKLVHGDCVTVRRSVHQVCFLHPLGWSYYATLRRKLRWNAGTSTG
jgi:NAD+ kinase